ncbi:MAG: DDE-type integrase/transposase/recombinase [Bacteroidota bacterium]
MIALQTRTSWDTSVKHYIRNGLYHNLPDEIKTQIPRTNIHRWSKEDNEKYLGCNVAVFINQELELIRKTNQSRNAKRILETYFKLSETYHHMTASLNGIRQKIKNNKHLLIETIEELKHDIPVDQAIKIFNISRATYQNYKTLVLNKCNASYFEWCVKRYPHQLLHKEVLKIKTYFENPAYQYWSKSSLYYLGVRNKDFGFCLATFYKYSKLLGYKSGRHINKKEEYKPLISTKPNQIWCADVTIHKTTDGVKHYIHFLIDHYSKMVLGYQIDYKSNPKIIKSLLKNAFEECPKSGTIQFVTDGGVENANKTVQNYIATTGCRIRHTIAQKDIPESNSCIEAFNKVIKNQFLRPSNPESRIELEKVLNESVSVYCNIRPQHSLGGNTPFESYNGKSTDFKQYKVHFTKQKLLRKTQNELNRCKECIN